MKDDGKCIAIEIKSSASEIPCAMGQCLYYKRGTHFVYVALPREEAVKLSDVDREMLESFGIGLLALDEEEESVIEAKEGIPEEDAADKLRNYVQIKPLEIMGLEEGILYALRQRGDMGATASQIARRIGRKREVISHYLRILKKAGRVTNRVGTFGLLKRI